MRPPRAAGGPDRPAARAWRRRRSSSRPLARGRRRGDPASTEPRSACRRRTTLASAVAAIPGVALGSGIHQCRHLVARRARAAPCPRIHDRTYAANLTNEGGVAGTVRVLRNVTGLWLLHECRRAWALAGLRPLVRGARSLAASAPALGACWSTPTTRVFAGPDDMPRRSREYCAQHRPSPGPTTPDAVVRCVLESLAVKHAADARSPGARATGRRSCVKCISSAAARATTCSAGGPATPSALPCMPGSSRPREVGEPARPGARARRARLPRRGARGRPRLVRARPRTSRPRSRALARDPRKRFEWSPRPARSCSRGSTRERSDGTHSPRAPTPGRDEDLRCDPARSRTCRSRCAAGETHALVGENGAGKSTLVKILAGVHPAGRRASIRIDGSEVLLDGPADARDAGIAIIYQEPILFPDLTVEENIFIGRQPLASGRRIDRRVMRAHVMAVFDRLGVRLDPARIAPEGCRSPSSRSWRSARPCRSTPRSSSWTSPTAASFGGRGRAPVQGRGEPPRRRRGGALHLASPRGGLRALPGGDGAARRPLGDQPQPRRSHLRRPRARDGRPRSRGPRDGGWRDGRNRAAGRAPFARGVLHRRLVRGESG